MLGIGITIVAGTLTHISRALLFEKPEPNIPGYHPEWLRPNPKPNV